MQAENDFFDKKDKIVENYLYQMEKPKRVWWKKFNELMNDVVTVMLIPHDRSKSYNLRIPKIMLWTLAVLLLATVSASVFFVVDYNNIQVETSKLAYLREANQDQENQIITLDREIRILRADMNQLKDTDIKLRTIADMDLIDETFLEAGNGEDDTLIGEIASDISRMELEISLRQKSYRELIEAAKKENGVFSNAPAIRPVGQGWIWQSYGKRTSPFTGQPEVHEGITFVSQKDTPVVATGNGRVESAAWGSKYGNYVLIDHSYGYKSFYAHLAKILVNPGQKIQRGNSIGFVGDSGRIAEGVGLFYQVRVNRKSVNPEDYFPAE